MRPAKQAWGTRLLTFIFAIATATTLSSQTVYAIENTLAPTDDTFVNSGFPPLYLYADQSYGSAHSLVGGRIPGGVTRWLLLRFDLSSIPDNAVVDSAYLRLYLYDSSGLSSVPIQVILLNESWSEGSVTWNTKPDLYGGSIAQLDIDSSLGYREWNLDPASIETRWIENSATNFGLILKGDYSGSQSFARSFRSKEYTNAGQHPQLIINYTLPDTTPPDLSNVTAGEIGPKAAAITWKTDEEATSWVEYWKTSGFVTTAGREEWTTTHRVILLELEPATTYTFQVRSADQEDNEAASNEHTFTTLEEVEGEEEAPPPTEEGPSPPPPPAGGLGGPTPRAREERPEVLGTAAETETETEPGSGKERLIAFGVGTLVAILAAAVFFFIYQKGKKKQVPPPKVSPPQAE